MYIDSRKLVNMTKGNKTILLLLRMEFMSRFIKNKKMSKFSPEVPSAIIIKFDQGPYSPTILKNILCLSPQDFVYLRITQLLIG